MTDLVYILCHDYGTEGFVVCGVVDSEEKANFWQKAGSGNRYIKTWVGMHHAVEPIKALQFYAEDGK